MMVMVPQLSLKTKMCMVSQSQTMALIDVVSLIWAPCHVEKSVRAILASVESEKWKCSEAGQAQPAWFTLFVHSVDGVLGKEVHFVLNILPE